MPSRSADPRRWLRDIRYHIELAQTFVAGCDYESFQNDRLRLYGVTRCLEIISEASRRLPAEMKARHASIAWKEMAGAGNIFRHDYQDVAARRVWRTIERDLPPLLLVVEQELAARE